MPDQPLARVVDDLLAKMRPALGLDRWQITVITAAEGDDAASCSAQPEYRIATVHVNPDKLDTGDELDEIVAHELVHALIWPLSNAADDLRIAVGELLPEAQRGAINRYLEEQNRRAEEDAATATGRAVVTLFRALWRAEAELAATRKELAALKKSLPGVTK